MYVTITVTNPKTVREPTSLLSLTAHSEVGPLGVKMYIYLQKTGELFEIELSLAVGSFSSAKDIVNSGGKLLGNGYSGKGDGRNNPDMEAHKMVGPIPCGWYHIGEPECVPPAPVGAHGPYVLSLTPDGHFAKNRSGFLIHGDNNSHTASCGCIVLDRILREIVGNGVSRNLLVANWS